MASQVKAVFLGLFLLLLAGAWYKFLAYEQGIGYAKAQGEYAVVLAAAKEESLKQEREWQRQLTEAQNEAAKNRSATEHRVADVTRVNVGLRDTVRALREQLPGDSLDTCRRAADTLSTVFGECQAEYAAMGRNAEGHLNDSLMCQTARIK